MAYLAPNSNDDVASNWQVAELDGLEVAIDVGSVVTRKVAVRVGLVDQVDGLRRREVALLASWVIDG